MISGSMADYLSTRHGLQMGLQEANPIARTLGPGNLIALTTGGADAFIVLSGHQDEFPHMATAERLAIGGLHLFAAAWNLHEIHQAQIARSNTAVPLVQRVGKR
jgi:hypothetical protein